MAGLLVASASSFIVFLLFQAKGIYTGDSGDLVTAAFLGGVPHPPGYPLYTLLGWLASRIPILTVSWRVALLSSIPHAITVGLVYTLIERMTKKNTLAAVFGASSLAVNYLFFLYSVTPEAFALFDLFVVLLWYLLILWQEHRDDRALYGASFVFGLSLAHHHVILFLGPALGYVLWVNRWYLLGGVKRRLRRLVMCTVLILLGLLPYGYVPLAASGDPMINWDRAVDWPGFLRLVTRADYGTFVSGGSFGQSIQERLLAVAAYGSFVLTDWRLVGILLTLIGLFVWFQNARIWFWTWILAVFCVGPAFFFYASFPLVSRFTLGTYERFLLPGYVLFAVALGTGFAWMLQAFDAVMNRWSFAAKKRRVVVVLVGITCMIYPLSLGGMTLFRFWGLSNDRTAEYLGRDILHNTPEGSILLLSQDTALFTTQYVRYVLGDRPDTVVIHAARLGLTDYQIVLKKHFPFLVFPESNVSGPLSWFVKANRLPSQRVYSNIILPVGEGWYWVPRGLVYEAIPVSELPKAEDMYQEALQYRTKMHDPRGGILSRYPHLMLSDVLDVYAQGHIALGKTLVRANRWEEARQEFAAATALSGDTSIVEALELLGISELQAKHCEAALAAFAQAQKRSFTADPVYLKLQSVTYGECVGDQQRASELFSEYEALRKASEQPLEAL